MKMRPDAQGLLAALVGGNGRQVALFCRGVEFLGRQIERRLLFSLCSAAIWVVRHVIFPFQHSHVTFPFLSENEIPLRSESEINGLNYQFGK
jgi:hypothetical protein